MWLLNYLLAEQWSKAEKHRRIAHITQKSQQQLKQENLLPAFWWTNVKEIMQVEPWAGWMQQQWEQEHSRSWATLLYPSVPTLSSAPSWEVTTPLNHFTCVSFHQPMASSSLFLPSNQNMLKQYLQREKQNGLERGRNPEFNAEMER